MIVRVHHVGIAVRDLAAGYGFWRDALGLPVVAEADLPDQGVRAGLLATGSCEVELLQPLDPEGGVARFLARRDESLHHLCFESDDVRREVARLRATEVEMIDHRPRKGLAGLVAFVHPRACAGVLVELATPVEPVPARPVPLRVGAVHALVEDVPGTVTLYGDLFNLGRGLTDPGGAMAQLAVGGVTLHLSRAGSARPGLSGLRLEAPDLDALAGRFDARGLAYRRGDFGLVLGANATHGVTLIIQPATGTTLFVDGGIVGLGPRS
jgi:methylmalonyl-CoA/ethylmalonyl-CoA epimerase